MVLHVRHAILNMIRTPDLICSGAVFRSTWSPAKLVRVSVPQLLL